MGLILIMMPKLHKIGLAVMLLGVIIAIGSVIARHNSEEPFYFDIYPFCMIALPAIIVTFIAWRWPLAGGFTAMVLSGIALLYLLLSVIDPSTEPSPDNFYIAITLCFVAGSVLILTSVGFFPFAKMKKRRG